MKSTTVSRNAEWYNPQFVLTEVSQAGTLASVEIANIRLFSKEGIKYEFKWFMQKNGHVSFIGDITFDCKLKLKRKPDYRLNHAFYIQVREKGDEPKCNLYIPLSAMCVRKHKKITRDWGLFTVDDVTYKVKTIPTVTKGDNADCTKCKERYKCITEKRDEAYFQFTENRRQTKKNRIEKDILKEVKASEFKDERQQLIHNTKRELTRVHRKRKLLETILIMRGK